MDNVIGSASILITPVSAGFEEKLAAQTAPGLGNFGKRAEKAGEEGGQKLSKGFSSGTSGIGKVLNNLGVPFSNFGGHLTSTADKMAKVDAQGSHLGATMAALGGKTLLGVGVAMTGVAAAGVDLAIKQEKVTTSIANSERISVKAAEGISNAFLSTAGSAIYSGRAIGEAFQPVAGVLGAIEGHALSSGESLKFMKAAMDLAEASGNKLGPTTETLAKVMQAYKVGVEGAGHASDVLWNASRQTGIGIDQLATVIGRVKGKLGDLAPSLGESAGLINTLAKNGAQGRVAVAALSTSLTTLTSNSKTTNDMAQQLGVHIFDSKGHFEGLRSVLTQVQKPMSELSEKEQLVATKALFGSAANKQLLGVILQGPAAFSAATKAVEHHGTAQEAAKRQGETLANQMKTLRATAEDLATKVGQFLIPVLTKLVHGLTDGVEWLKKHETAAKALAVVIATVLGAAIGSFVAVKVAAFIGGTKQMIDAMVTMGGKMLATAGIMQTADTAMVTGADEAAVGVDAALMGTGIGATLVLLGAAAFLLSENWETVMQALETATEAAGNFVIGILNSLIEAFNETIGELTGDIGKIEELTPEGGGIRSDEKGRGGEHFTRKEEKENEEEGTLGEKGKGGLAQKSGGLMAFFMKELHLSAAAAAGIAGNVMQESKFNPNAPGGGLFQYIESRAASGKGSFYQQLQATKKELQGPYSGVLSQLQKAKTPEEAARIWEKGFEKPEPGSESKREQYAKEAFKIHPQAAAEHKHTTAMEHHSKAIEGASKHLATTHEGSTKATKHATEVSTATITKWAEQHVGKFAESTGKNTGPELDALQKEFHTRAAAWCAEFATTAAMMGGANKAVRTASVATIREWAEQGSHGYKKGVTHSAATGDIAMFGNEHAGFVQSVNKRAGTFVDIEGNTAGGHVERITRKISEADFARPAYKKVEAGGEELKQISTRIDNAAKAAFAKMTADKKAGESQLSKIVGAIHSGGVKELTEVVGGKHDKWLAALERRLHGDHTSALDALVKKLTDAHTKALAALQKALVKAAEKAAIERGKHETDVATVEADNTAKAIEDATKTRLDSMSGASSAQLNVDQVTAHWDEVIGHFKLEVAKAAGRGEGPEAYAAQQLAGAENQAKVAEAQARATLEITTAEERDTTEKARLKVEEERLKQEREGKVLPGGTTAPSFNIVINGANLSTAELLQEIGFQIKTGNLPVAT